MRPGAFQVKRVRGNGGLASRGRRVGTDFALAIAFAAAGACGPDELATEAPAGDVRDSAGVEIVWSAAPEAPDGSWTIDPEPLLQIGEVTGEEAYQFTYVADATRFPDGRIAVVDGRTSEIRIFDPDGVHVRTVGRKGEGPGEFDDRPFIAIAPPDTLVAWGPRERRMTWFDDEGAILREESLISVISELDLSVVGGGSVWDVRPDGTLLFLGMGFDGDLGDDYVQTSEPVLIRELGDATARYGVYPDAGRVVIDSRGISRPFEPLLTWDMGPPPLPVTLGGQAESEVRFFDAGGTLVRIARAAIPGEPVTAEMVEAEIESTTEWSGLTAEQIEGAWEELGGVPDSLPPVASIDVDLLGNVWLGRGTEEWFDASAWDVFSPGGRWLATVPSPPSITNGPLEIGEDYVLVSWRDELDVSYLRMHRLSRGG